MALARPYFDRQHFDRYTREQLVDMLIEAKTRAFELNGTVQRLETRVEAAEPYYATGQPCPVTPGDGAWEGD